MNLLNNLNFRLNSLEDVYEEANVDDCLQRLLDYEAEFRRIIRFRKSTIRIQNWGRGLPLFVELGGMILNPYKGRNWTILVLHGLALENVAHPIPQGMAGELFKTE